MKHTQGKWINGYAQGITGPSTPTSTPTVGEAVKYNDWQEAGSDYSNYPKTKHTVVSVDKETVAIIPLCRGDGEANAKLIAAAPDLSEANSAVENQMYNSRKTADGSYDIHIPAEMAESIKAANAKATN